MHAIDRLWLSSRSKQTCSPPVGNGIYRLSFGYSIYGILALIFWPTYSLWHEKLNYLNSLKATFINPNIAAVYFLAPPL
jgi:hypothetical protein